MKFLEKYYPILLAFLSFLYSIFLWFTGNEMEGRSIKEGRSCYLEEKVQKVRKEQEKANDMNKNCTCGDPKEFFLKHCI